MADKLIAALNTLDPQDDTHWTQTGLPALLIVKRAAGMVSVTRADVLEAAPGLTRETFSTFDFSAQSDDADGDDSTVQDHPVDVTQLRRDAQDANAEVEEAQQALQRAQKARSDAHAKLVDNRRQATLQECNTQFKAS